MATRKKVTWLASTETKELHRVVDSEDHPGQCNLASIKPEHRKKFKTAKAAFEQGFDSAAYCRRKFRSRR